MGNKGQHFSGHYEAMDAEENTPSQVELGEAKRLALKLMASQGSLVDFRREFIPLPNEVPSAWFHHYWSDILLNGEKNFVAEGFRESGKTSLVIKGAPLHALTFPREDRSYIVFLLNNATLAQKRLQEIVEAYEGNRDLSANLIRTVEYKPSLGFYEAEVTDGERNFNVRIEAYGKGASIRGLSWKDRRPDLVIIDDPQDKEDVDSDLVVDRDWDWFLTEVKFLGKDARIFLIGNNLGEKCIVERCLEAKEILEFEGRRIPIADEQFIESQWPEKYPIEYVTNERDTYTELGKADIWWRERMCKSTSPQSQRFRKDLFRYYIPSEMEGQMRRMVKYTTVDLAIGTTKRSDFTVVMTIAVDAKGNWFILDAAYGKWNPTETMNEIFSAVVKHKPRVVGIESVAYQAALIHFLDREMSSRNIFFTVHRLESDRRKDLRIEGMHPRFSAGKVFFPAGASFLAELEKELLGFPRATHDDLIDALAYQEQVAAPPSGWGESSGVDESKLPIAGGM